MNIYLIRHADAEKSSPSKKDYERKLTPEGISAVKSAAEGWKNLISSFDYIISSPLKRALQTAEIIAKTFQYAKEIVTDKRIAGGKTEDLIEIANSLDGKEIAFIGHEPDFSKHVSSLISSSGAFLSFKKGMIAKISFENKARLSKGNLEFLIPAKAYKLDEHH
jgi:phosphohistidine phosphatase